ncbi:MAG: beta-galactosidase [Clostridiales bacterium]|nr:beta-galactosidase [Clostridiales bacterium]
MKKLYFGAAYYPELWDKSEIDEDIKRCKELGLNVLRVGEFAWGKMEPREGEYDLDWLECVVDKLHKAGIVTVMCTPTCTPPRYMLDKYEEMRNVSDRGVRTKTSWRCHPCKTSHIMREKNRGIVTEMAKRFGSHPGIIGWQIDNELYPYGGGCYCPLCVKEFQKYLKNKFKTVDALNDAWGMSRWSLDYQSFDAVNPPLDGEWKHPSLVKAWWDFQCRQIKTYIDEQAEILHKYTKVPIGTDMMSNNNLGYYETTHSLDIVQFNHYNKAEELYETEFWYDFLRCVKDKPFWVTETQVGWNGSTFAACGARPTGNCFINTILPFAHGADMNMYWLFRAHRNGHELSHGALYSTSGQLYSVSFEVEEAIKLISKHEKTFTSPIKSDIALSFSSTAANTFMAAPMLENFDYTATIRDKYYTALRHYNVDVIDTAHSLDEYKVVISPFMCHARENNFKERITEFVKSGGTWIVGPMTDIVDTEVTKYTKSTLSFVEEMVGAELLYQRPIENPQFKAEWNDGTPCEISMCYDSFLFANPLATYTAGDFGKEYAVVQKEIGKGKVILVGSVLSHKDLRRLIEQNPILKASDNVSLTERGAKTKTVIAVEIENKQGFIEFDGRYKSLLTGDVVSGKITIEPYSVDIFEKI